MWLSLLLFRNVFNRHEGLINFRLKILQNWKFTTQNSGVCLKIAGYSHCHWTERQSRGSDRNKRPNRTVNYIGREDYIWTTTYFLGSEQGEWHISQIWNSFFSVYIPGIRILIYGQSTTSWCETESYFEDGKKKSKDIFYSADEVYLDAKAYLLGMGDNGTN